MILTRTTLASSSRSPREACRYGATRTLASAKSHYEASTLVNVHLLAALKVMKNFIPQIIRPSAVKSGPNSKSARRRRTTRVEINLKVQCDLRRTILRARRQVNGSLLRHRRSTVPYSRLKNIETLSFSAMGDVLEISNLIVMVVARSLVFDMLSARRKCDLAMRSETVAWPPRLSSHLRFATNH
jgi:hypothetical protein